MKYRIFLLIFAFLSFSKAIDNDYRVEYSKDIINNGVSGVFASIKYEGKDDYYKKPTSPILKNLNYTAIYENEHEFTLTITDAESKRFSIPKEFPFPYTKRYNASSSDYQVQIEEDSKKPFSFKVTRASTKETIFDTSDFDFIYSDLFYTFGTKLPSRYLYGLGERARDFGFKSGTYTIYNQDIVGIQDFGEGGQQKYGNHPVYLMREKSGKWHMVYLKTSNGLDFIFDADKKTIQFKVTGGTMEFKFIFGDEYPDTVIKRYHEYVNGWRLQPFWAHGFHICRWGYKSTKDLWDVYHNMTVNKLPIDSIWTDIDALYNNTNFIIDPKNFPLDDLKEIAKKVHWVAIIDDTIPINKTTPGYVVGNEMDIWIKSGEFNGDPIIGVSWAGNVLWPDWFHPNISTYMDQMIKLYWDQVPFAGLWLDMNEPSNFCEGEYPHGCFYLNESPLEYYNRSANRKPVLAEDLTDYPKEFPPSNKDRFNSSWLPYIPGNILPEHLTLSIDAYHHDREIEHNLHQINTVMQNFHTFNALKNATKSSMPFMITRSTSPGVGQFGAKWTGDNVANFRFMEISVSEIFNFQIYGIPMTGSDICGFVEVSTAELCARWYQLGAMYPFMRNQKGINLTHQEPYNVGPSVLKTAAESLKLRYSLVKFYYSLFVRNNGTGTIFRPTFFDFPFDEKLFDLHHQFLLGSELLGAGVFQEGVEETAIYFPGGAKWYNYYTGKVIWDSNKGKNITVPAPLNASLPLFIRGGKIVHRQNVDYVQNTENLDSTLHFLVALAPSNRSKSTFTANGQFMGIADFSHEPSLMKCQGGNDCIVDIGVEVEIKSMRHVIANITFAKRQENSVLEELVSYNEFVFYGVKRTRFGREFVVKCETSTPVQIKYGSFEINLSDESKCKWTLPKEDHEEVKEDIDVILE